MSLYTHIHANLFLSSDNIMCPPSASLQRVAIAGIAHKVKRETKTAENPIRLLPPIRRFVEMQEAHKNQHLTGRVQQLALLRGLH